MNVFQITPVLRHVTSFSNVYLNTISFFPLFQIVKSTWKVECGHTWPVGKLFLFATFINENDLWLSESFNQIIVIIKPKSKSKSGIFSEDSLAEFHYSTLLKFYITSWIDHIIKVES